MTTEHCCRLPYLARTLGVSVFEILYCKVQNINCVHLIMSYMPDERVHRKYQNTLAELCTEGDLLVYSEHHRIPGRFSYAWDDVNELLEYLLENYPVPISVCDAVRLKSTHLIVCGHHFLTVENQTWSLDELEYMEVFEDDDRDSVDSF